MTGPFGKFMVFEMFRELGHGAKNPELFEPLEPFELSERYK
jgi:hypothetical protein